jgi:hypothetical protein
MDALRKKVSYGSLLWREDRIDTNTFCGLQQTNNINDESLSSSLKYLIK